MFKGNKDIRNTIMRVNPQECAISDLTKGLKLDTIDLLIGSTALLHDVTIVTHNTKHFARIPGLKIEDWETE